MRACRHYHCLYISWVPHAHTCTHCTHTTHLFATIHFPTHTMPALILPAPPVPIPSYIPLPCHTHHIPPPPLPGSFPHTHLFSPFTDSHTCLTVARLLPHTSLHTLLFTTLHFTSCILFIPVYTFHYCVTVPYGAWVRLVTHHCGSLHTFLPCTVAFTVPASPASCPFAYTHHVPAYLRLH